jgi:hypothetical protein
MRVCGRARSRQRGQKDERAADDGCIAAAKKPAARTAKAEMAGFDKAKTFATQNGNVTVRIPWTQDGKTGAFACIMTKQSEGLWTAVQTN